MNPIYRYNIINSVEHPDHIVVKTANGRYFELTKSVYQSVKKLVQADGTIDCKTLSPAILASLSKKNMITASSTTKSNHIIKYHWRKAVLQGPGLMRFCQALEPMIQWRFFVLFMLLSVVWAGVFIDPLSQIFAADNIDHAIDNITYADMLAIVLFIFISGMVHETGHGIAHQKYTGNSYEIGVCVNYVLPSFYADVSDTVMLNSKFKKVIIGLCGIYFQLLLYPFVITLLIFIGNNDMPVYITLLMGLQMMLNLFPAMRNDGYWIYCDLFNIKQNVESSAKSHLSGKEKVLYLLAIPGMAYIGFITMNGLDSLMSILMNMVQGGFDGLADNEPFDFIRAMLALIYLTFAIKILFILTKKASQNRKNKMSALY